LAKRLFAILIIALSLLFVISCAQRETDIGANAIVTVPADSFRIISGTATHSAGWIPDFTNGFGASLEIGETDGLYAWSVIRFDVRTRTDSIRVDSMFIRFFRNRVWPGPGLPGRQVRIRQVPDSAGWTESTLKPNALPGRPFYPIVDSLEISSTDTTFTYLMRNPATIWERWRANLDTNGILLEPRFSGGLIEFYSRGAAGATYVPYMFIHGQIWRATDSVWVDSSITVSATADGYQVVDTRVIPASRMVVTQGHATRTALFFPFDSLSGDFRRTVTRAELHLYADTTNRYTIRYIGRSNQMNHGIMNRSTWVTDPTQLNSDSTIAGYESGSDGYGHWNSATNEVVMDVSGAVAYWVANPTKNGGLQILSTDELGALLSCEVFHSALSEDSLKKPRLYIWYTDTSH
jgi:hypothetical protein